MSNWFDTDLSNVYDPELISEGLFDAEIFTRIGTIFEKTGNVTSEAVAIGVDVFEAAETGAGVSEAVVAGADVFESSETGLSISAAIAAGTRIRDVPRTGAAVTDGVLAGSGLHESPRAGLAILDDSILSGPSLVEQAPKFGTAIIGEVLSPVTDTVFANGIRKDYDPPSGIDNVDRIVFDPTAQPYEVGIPVECPQGSGSIILAKPPGAVADTEWDLSPGRSADAGFGTSVRATTGTQKVFTSNLVARGLSGTVEPIAPGDDGDVEWQVGPLYFPGAWPADTVVATGLHIIESGFVWACVQGGTTVSDLPDFTASQSSNFFEDGNPLGVAWFRQGIYKGPWASETFYGIDVSGDHLSVYRHYVSVDSDTKLLSWKNTILPDGGAFQVSQEEPIWGAAPDGTIFLDGEDGKILWIQGSDLFGGGASGGKEQLVATGFLAPADDGKVLEIVNGAALGTQMVVVLADHGSFTDYYHNTGTSWTRVATDADSAVGNRFDFGGRFKSLYLMPGGSVYIVYSAGSGTWSHLNNPQGMSLFGDRAATHSRQRIAISAAVAKGVSSKSKPRAGDVVSELSLTGTDIYEAVETGAAISDSILSGASEIEAGSHDGTVVSELIASGSETPERHRAGAAESALVASGTDAFTASETGLVESEIQATGTDVHEAIETGTAISEFVASGGEEKELERAGLAISDLDVSGISTRAGSSTGRAESDLFLAGTDVFEASETGSVASDLSLTSSRAIARVRAGVVVIEFIASGADISEHSETGKVTSSLVASGADVYEATETGSVISAARATGTDVFEAIETGTVVSDLSITGTKLTTKARAGAIISDLSVTGTDIYEAVRAGLVTSAASLSGMREAVFNRAGSVISGFIAAGVSLYARFFKHGHVTLRDSYLSQVTLTDLAPAATLTDHIGEYVAMNDAAASVTLEDQLGNHANLEDFTP